MSAHDKIGDNGSTIRQQHAQQPGGPAPIVTDTALMNVASVPNPYAWCKTARSAAQRYCKQGWSVIPVFYKSKQPAVSKHNELRLTESNLDEYFPEGVARNIGVLNGTASGNLVDVDLDCPEAAVVAPFLLPATGTIFGRLSSPSSHWLYKTTAPLQKAQ